MDMSIIAITIMLCVGHGPAADESWYLYGQIYAESDCVHCLLCVLTNS